MNIPKKCKYKVEGLLPEIDDETKIKRFIRCVVFTKNKKDAIKNVKAIQKANGKNISCWKIYLNLEKGE